MWTVYVLKSTVDEGYYIGCTGNLEQRLAEHNAGYTVSLKRRRPLTVVYTETYEDKSVAYLREKKLKSFKGSRAFKALLCVGGGVVNRNRL